jgi:hypothetical protein
VTGGAVADGASGSITKSVLGKKPWLGAGGTLATILAPAFLVVVGHKSAPALHRHHRGRVPETRRGPEREGVVALS